MVGLILGTFATIAPFLGDFLRPAHFVGGVPSIEGKPKTVAVRSLIRFLHCCVQLVYNWQWGNLNYRAFRELLGLIKRQGDPRSECNYSLEPSHDSEVK